MLIIRLLIFPLLLLALVSCAVNPSYSPEHPALSTCQISPTSRPRQENFPHADFLKIPLARGILESPVTEHFIQVISAPLRRAYGVSSDYTKIFVVPDMGYAARTYPNDNIYISLGVFAKAKSNDEVAAVIAHEMGHVACRHDRQKQAEKIGEWLLKAGSIGIMFAGPTIPGTNTIQVTPAILGGSFAAQKAQTSFEAFANAGWSRTQETKADLLTVDALKNGGYSIRGLDVALNQLPEEASGTPHGFFSGLTGGSHPSASERVNAIHSYIPLVYGSGYHAPTPSSEALKQWAIDSGSLLTGLQHIVDAANALGGPLLLIGHPEVISQNDSTSRALEHLRLAFGIDQNVGDPKILFYKILSSKDSEIKALSKLFLSQWVIAETKARLDRNIQDNTIELNRILKSELTPRWLWLYKALGQLKSQDYVSAIETLEKTQARFGDDSMLFPLQFAAYNSVLLPLNGKPIDDSVPIKLQGKDAALQIECMATADLGIMKLCSDSKNNPGATIDIYWKMVTGK